MNYINLLTKDEKSFLCEIITGKEFKEFFKRNEQDFSKMQKGFRAKSLTEQHALAIAITNIDNPFIAVWVNQKVDYWLKDIQESITKLERTGLSHNAALATAMTDSYFVNNIELYFKLSGKPLDTFTCSNLYERIESIKSERAKAVEMADRLKSMEEENRRLSDQIEVDQRTIEALKNECEEKVSKIEQDKSELVSSLAEAHKKISELQTAPTAFTIDDADYLSQFDDTDASILPSDNTDEIISLCSVISDHNGQKWLMRHADLNINGCYDIFHRNENIPPYFTNRDKIFYKDGPSNDGFYGIWNWSAVPNENDSSKDYILSRYNTTIDAIEIAVITEATSLDVLVNLLKKGINYQPHSRKIIFSFCSSKQQYTGILFTSKELSIVNGKTVISKDCITAPVYKFVNDDLIRLDSSLSFYRNVFAGPPVQIYHLKSPLEIVKDIVFASISWTAYKTRNVTRAEYKTFKDFISAIPVDNIMYKIETACRCSSPAAKELLDEFLHSVWKYIDGDSLEDEIVLSAISVNSNLQEKTKALIRKDWEIENESLLGEAHEELNLLHTELKSANEKLSKLQESFIKTKAEDERLSDIIAEKEKLAEDVEKNVAAKIQKAREDVADFIANMAFVNGQQVQSIRDTLPSPNKVPLEPNIATYCTYSQFENTDDIDAHHSWADVINTAIFELAEAGVTERYRSGLAAFLCAAYIEKQPLLLVGPNAIDIALAFIASVSGHKYGLLCCEGTYSNHAIKQLGDAGEGIIIINNLLTSGWINRLPEILSKKDIFFIATHPYTEDILVEPKSLYGFMLPLFTELFVDKKATGKYYGGYFADDFKPYSPNGITHKELAVLSKVALSSLVKSRINSLVAVMHDIYSSATSDDDFLFCIFPVFYASMTIDEISATITDPQKGISISADLKRDLRYILGEI